MKHISLFELIQWLFSKDKRKCPRCNYPVTKKNTRIDYLNQVSYNKKSGRSVLVTEFVCPNCNQELRWPKK